MVKYLDNNSGFNNWAAMQSQQKKQSKSIGFWSWLILFLLAWWIMGLFIQPKNQQTQPQQPVVIEASQLEPKKIDSEKRKAWTRKNKKDLAIGIGIIIVFIFFVILYFVNKSLIIVGYTKDELIGLNYKIVEDKLESRGFENIETKEINDLIYKDKNKKEVVTDVLISNRDNYNKNSKYMKNEEIIIIYHSLIKTNPPLTNKEVKKMNYKEVEKQFKNNGFENIKIEKIQDLVTGWITKDGEVETVTINKDTKFDINSEYLIDAEVIIKYHTFKK